MTPLLALEFILGACLPVSLPGVISTEQSERRNLVSIVNLTHFTIDRMERLAPSLSAFLRHCEGAAGDFGNPCPRKFLAGINPNSQYFYILICIFAF
jgi:hypothetical protein